VGAVKGSDDAPERTRSNQSHCEEEERQRRREIERSFDICFLSFLSLRSFSIIRGDRVLVMHSVKKEEGGEDEKKWKRKGLKGFNSSLSLLNDILMLSQRRLCQLTLRASICSAAAPVERLCRYPASEFELGNL
jgi:hypothetical protein